jgi:hypothetical protein
MVLLNQMNCGMWMKLVMQQDHCLLKVDCFSAFISMLMVVVASHRPSEAAQAGCAVKARMQQRGARPG